MSIDRQLAEMHGAIGHLQRQLARRRLEDAGQARLFREARIDRDFRDFHEQHPEVYAGFKTLAFQLRASGCEHYSSKAIFEVLRFFSAVNNAKDGGWKLNNSFTSRYARLLIAEHPEFRDFFELRRLRSTDDEAAALPSPEARL